MNPRRVGLVSTRLQQFLAVAHEGAIRRAARTLNVAPSAVSRNIRHLEEDIGTSLFERVNRRLKLTSAGETLSYHARASVQELSHACALMQDMQELRRGKVSIVAVESIARGLLPKVLDKFWARYANISVEIHVAGSTEAVEAMMHGTFDLAIAFDVRGRPKARRLASITLNTGALLRADHPMARCSHVRLRDFAGEPLLIAEPDLTLGSSLAEAMLEAGLEPHTRVVTNSIHTLIEFAMSGRGVTFQTRVGVERELARGDLVFIPVLDQSFRPRQLVLLSRESRQLPAGPTALAAMLIEAMHELEASVPATTRAANGARAPTRGKARSLAI